MSHFRLVPLGAALAVIVTLSGCSAATPTPIASSSVPVDHTEQATIDGEWVLTRTVVTSDEVNNPARAEGAVSTRNVKFGDVVCTGGPCTGGVLSGPTTGVRDQTTFTSSGNVIHYEYSGFLNCLRQDTGAVLVADGYSYTSTIDLTMATTVEGDETTAATLEGTMTYTDTVTTAALEAGCSREPVTAITTYSLTAVRGAAVPVTAPTTAP